MDNLIEYFGTIEQAFRKTKMLTVATLVCAGCIAIGSLVFAFSYASSKSDLIYVTDNMGQTVSARADDAGLWRGVECKDHVMRFHEYMFNLSPSSDAIQRNIDRALVLADRSAYDYYLDMSEREYYSRLVNANIIQQIVVDSIHVNTNSYPHDVHTYATIYLTRESNITSYAFESTARIVEMGRSESNPHGLMLERFNVIRNDKIETRRRR